MLTLRDFLDYCDLTEEEVGRVAKREHVPPIVAAQLALIRRQGIDPVTGPLLSPARGTPAYGAASVRLPAR